jgi:hypothetical protein
MPGVLFMPKGRSAPLHTRGSLSTKENLGVTNTLTDEHHCAVMSARTAQMQSQVRNYPTNTK